MDLFTHKDAIFSECGSYRYELRRIWDVSMKPCLFLMLNPSTADEVDNDPTVERCERRAREMGFGGLVVCNLFAYRATDPDVMKSQADPVGPMNDMYLLVNARHAGIVVCAWGNHGSHRGRSEQVMQMLLNRGIQLHALQINGSGEPKHPLYVGYERKPMEWRV